LSTILRGIGQIKRWFSLVLGIMLLQRESFQKVAEDNIMTGPALLLGILGTVSFSATLAADFTWVMVSFQIIAWFFTILIMYLAGRLLRGKATYSAVLRVIGFAQGIYLLDLFSFIPAISSVVRFIVSLLVFIAVWIGAATAHNLRSWRTLVLPIVYIVVFLLSFVIIYSVIGGLTLTLESLGAEFGLFSPP
jgi:hypothetical protein